jgi:uncharacterized membrane protein
MSPPMPSSQLQYLPINLTFFTVLVGVFLVLLVLIQLQALRYAYSRLGISSPAVLLLLFGSLVGSYFNIPIAELPGERIVAAQPVASFGMTYVVPVVVEWPGTIIAVNVGGALIPGLLSLYLLAKNRLWLRGIVAIACVAAVSHWLAEPVPGAGIALPVFVPPLTAAVTALVLSRRYAAPLAFIGGSLGALIGADLLNLDKVPGLGAPVVSIGGAGTFDGVFLSGILGVLFASLTRRPDRPEDEPARSMSG